MINYIYTKGSQKAILFNDITMNAELIEKIDKGETDIKTETSAERVVSIEALKSPSMISRIVLDYISEDKIVFRNKNIRVKIKKEVDTYLWGSYISEQFSDIIPYNVKDDRVMTVDLINNVIKINYRNQEEVIDFSIGTPFDRICETVRKKFFKFVSAQIITDDDFFEEFKAMMSKSKKFNYILNLKNSNFGVGAKDLLEHGVNIDKTILAYRNYSFYEKTSSGKLFANQLSGLLFMMNNPGVESLYNSPYSKMLYSEIFIHNRTFEKPKLHEVLGVSKSTVKMMRVIADKINENISLLSSAKCDKNAIMNYISKTVYNDKHLIDNAIKNLNGYNNLERIIDDYFENNFYNDYFFALDKNSHYIYSWYSQEKKGEILFKNSVTDIASNISGIIYEVNSLFCMTKVYLNNINHFSEYISNLTRRQGFQKISSGIELLKDYIKMQEQMEAKWEKYPNSIHLVHDIASNNMRFFDNNDIFKENCAGFLEAVADYADLNYFDKKTGLMAVSPNSFNEMFVEGCSLNHCVASYIPEVASRKSKIMFIRKKEEQSVPYFTVEIIDNIIKQVKGINQIDPADSDLIKFIDNWASKKELKIRYR